MAMQSSLSSGLCAEAEVFDQGKLDELVTAHCDVLSLPMAASKRFDAASDQPVAETNACSTEPHVYATSVSPPTGTPCQPVFSQRRRELILQRLTAIDRFSLYQ